ncbi:hypothetical protein [Pseudomonas putida]|uniref:hypothetical protein n=1 Tax=Pseudomonas putida TaxID=303 RepID=UPI0009034816|nr:hypothetical protein [Pseudomonas putida]APE99616.1 hypothetical protein BG030_17065 [Pseudomonas putida]
MDTNKMREQFEAWVSSEYPNQSLERFNPLHGVTEGEYTGFTVQHCWQAWQASREAVVVDLPSEDTCRTSTSKEEAVQEAYNHALGECRAAIEAQGLKVEQ